MASGWYNNGVDALFATENIAGGSPAVFKIMPVKTSYVFSATTQDEDVLTNSAANEIVATTYVGGHAGSGRKTTTVTHQNNDTTDPGRVEIACSNVTWTALGGATNDTIHGFVLFIEKASDATSIPICFFDTTDTTTNGGNIDLTFAALGAGGNLQVSCTRA
jgi:hypothetical protein